MVNFLYLLPAFAVHRRQLRLATLILFHFRGLAITERSTSAEDSKIRCVWDSSDLFALAKRAFPIAAGVAATLDRTD